MISTTCEYMSSPPSSRVPHLSDSSSATRSGWDGEGGLLSRRRTPRPKRKLGTRGPQRQAQVPERSPCETEVRGRCRGRPQAASRKAPPSSPLLDSSPGFSEEVRRLPASRPHPGLRFLFSRNVLAYPLSGNSPDHGHPGAIVFPLTPPQAAIRHWGSWEEPQWVWGSLLCTLPWGQGLCRREHL